MTERMSHSDIEDVLSSIRRLVSEDLKVSPPAAPVFVRQPVPAPEAQVEPAPAGPRRPRLVLTRSHRIEPEAQAPVVAAPPLRLSRADAAAEAGALRSGADIPEETPAAGDRPETADTRDPSLTLEARIAELEAILSTAPQGFEPDEGDIFPRAARAAPQPAPPGFDEPFEIDPADGLGTLTGPAAPAQGAAPPAEDPQTEEAPEAPFFDCAADPAGEEARPVPILLEDPVSIAEVDPPAHSGLAWTLRAPPMPEDEAEPPAQVYTLDEAELRALVQAVLIEELQGRVGERVTRNLRKIVRAEVVRALAARGLV